MERSLVLLKPDAVQRGLLGTIISRIENKGLKLVGIKMMTSKVISDPGELGHYQVTAEILGDVAGPKINIIHYKNKTGYRRRMGHRQRYTQVKITGISAERKAAARKKS